MITHNDNLRCNVIIVSSKKILIYSIQLYTIKNNVDMTKKERNYKKPDNELKKQGI